jgi:gamma-glutamylputrescine oxidase
MSISYLNDRALPPSYYEASAGKRVDYPTLAGSVDCDVCVAGGGLAGLHTALNLAEQGLKVALLEARRVGWGASGRNGGHVIPEFACGMKTFEDALGIDAARRCWTLAQEGAERVRERIATFGIDCDYRVGHIEAAVTPRHTGHLREWQERAARLYDRHYRFIGRAEMRQFVGSDRYHGGLLDSTGGHLHPLRFTLGMARALASAGGMIFENSPVQSWQDGDRVRVRTAAGEIVAKTLVLACNVGMDSITGSEPQRLARRILPVGTWIIATAPLSEALADELLPTRAAVADNRVVLDYFRLSADNRMVFGGGCSYLGQGTPAGFAESLRSGMLKVFPQLAQTPVDFQWGGVIDCSMSRAPDFGRLNDASGKPSNVYYAQGFSGSGLVATAAAGRVLAEAVTGDSANLDMFMRLTNLPFPGGPMLRGPLTAAGMLWARLRDQF